MQTINNSYTENKKRLKHNIEQRTPEWLTLRLGRFTSSNIFKLMTNPRSKAAKEAGELSATAKSYVLEKAAELVYNTPAPVAFSAAMDWGNEHEETAVKAYENISGNKVSPGAFWTFGDYTGTSPDGLLNETGTNESGLIEIKCPYNRVNHLENCLTLKTADDLKAKSKQYYYQVQHQLYITGRAYCDFVSFDPRLLTGENWALCCHAVRIERNETEIDEIERKINGAAEYLETIIKAL